MQNVRMHDMGVCSVGVHSMRIYTAVQCVPRGPAWRGMHETACFFNAKEINIWCPFKKTI